MDERHWQDAVGGGLQERAYARAGTRAVIDRQHARLGERLAIRAGGRLLDVGCGVGHLLHWLEQHAGVRGHGVDVSLSSARRAHALRQCAVSVADAACLPFAAERYAAVVCNGSAHHLPDLPAALREMWRVLEPHGLLLLHEPVDTPITGMLRRAIVWRARYESPADLAHKDAFTRPSVEQALRATGFVGVDATAFDAIAYPLSGMYMALPWSGSRRIMGALISVEDRLARAAWLRPAWNALAWRVLFSARKPG